MSQQTCLISGASGYIGSQLATHLLEKGWRVHCLTRSQKTPLLQPLEGRVECQHYDGSSQSLRQALEIASPDVVFHLAAFYRYEVTIEEITPLIDANIRLGVQLLQGMNEVGCRQIINTGTFFQHGESRDYLPNSLYAATKQAFQDCIDYYTQAEGFSAITLKLYDVYGENDPRPKLFHALRQATREPLKMTPGEQILNMVHISDVVAAFTSARSQLKPNQHDVYFVPGESHSLKEIATLFQEISGEELQIEWGGLPYRRGQIMKPYLGESLPQWRAHVSLSEGLRRFLEHV